MDLWAPRAGKHIGSRDGQHIPVLLPGRKPHIRFVDIFAFLQRVSNVIFPSLGLVASVQSTAQPTPPYDFGDNGHRNFLALSEFISPNVIRLRRELDMCAPDAAPLHINGLDTEYRHGSPGRPYPRALN